MWKRTFLAHQLALHHTTTKAGTASRSSFKDVATKLVCVSTELLIVIEELFTYLSLKISSITALMRCIAVCQGFICKAVQSDRILVSFLIYSLICINLKVDLLTRHAVAALRNPVCHYFNFPSELKEMLILP